MLNIAVCDNNRIVNELCRKMLDNILKPRSYGYKITTFESGKDLISIHNTKEFDLIFLDIIMPEINGFEVAKQLRLISFETQIVFITSKQELVYETFDYQPFYFIRKTNSQQIKEGLEKVINKLFDSFKQNTLMTIKDCNKCDKFKIFLYNVIYITSEKHYIFVHCQNYEENVFKQRGSITQEEAKLKNCNFIKVHNRYLINLRLIKKFDTYSNTITMCDGSKIPIGKSFKEHSLQTYYAFLRGDL